MSPRNTGNWTEERVARLRELNSLCMSAAEIAAELGGVTRNAVIGKLNRMGDGLSTGGATLMRNAEEIRAGRLERQRNRRKARPGNGRRRFVFPSMANISDVAEIVARSKAPDHLGLKLHDLRDGLFECRYIHGDNQETPYTFCAQPVQPGSSFCAYHHRLCYNGVPPRPRKTSFSERRAA